MIRLGIVGCGGRMGQMLVKGALEGDLFTLAAGVDRPGSSAVGRDLAELVGKPAIGVLVGDNPRALFETCDAAIDFTQPASTVMHARLAAETGTPLVCGATGMDQAAMQTLREASEHTALLWSSNFSLGVALLHSLVEQVAARLDPSYDIEIVEMHHRHKVDSPSGTALTLGAAAAKGRKVHLDQVWRKSRDGAIGERPRGEIGFSTLRGGDVVGDHAVIFAGTGERLELGHRATSREVFANGALYAARWLANKPAGFYSVADVLGLKKP